MIISPTTPVNALDIWAPRYKDKTADKKEWVFLLAKYKVDMGAPIIVVTVTKAKHLLGKKLCITRKDAQQFPLGSNTKIPCYEVPLTAFEAYETPQDIKKTVDELFPLNQGD